MATEFRSIVVKVSSLYRKRPCNGEQIGRHRCILLWNNKWEPVETVVIDETSTAWSIPAEYRSDAYKRMRSVSHKKFCEFMDSIGSRCGIPDDTFTKSIIVAIKMQDRGDDSKARRIEKSE